MRKRLVPGPQDHDTRTSLVLPKTTAKGIQHQGREAPPRQDKEGADRPAARGVDAAKRRLAELNARSAAKECGLLPIERPFIAGREMTRTVTRWVRRRLPQTDARLVTWRANSPEALRARLVEKLAQKRV